MVALKFKTIKMGVPLSCIRIFKIPCHTWREVMLSVANEELLPLSFCLATQSRSFTLLLFPSVVPMHASLTLLFDLYLPFLTSGKQALRCSRPFLSWSVYLLSPSWCFCLKWFSLKFALLCSSLWQYELTILSPCSKSTEEPPTFCPLAWSTALLSGLASWLCLASDTCAGAWFSREPASLADLKTYNYLCKHK